MATVGYKNWFKRVEVCPRCGETISQDKPFRAYHRLGNFSQMYATGLIYCGIAQCLACSVKNETFNHPSVFPWVCFEAVCPECGKRSSRTTTPNHAPWRAKYLLRHWPAGQHDTPETALIYPMFMPCSQRCYEGHRQEFLGANPWHAQWSKPSTAAVASTSLNDVEKRDSLRPAAAEPARKTL